MPEEIWIHLLFDVLAGRCGFHFNKKLSRDIKVYGFRRKNNSYVMTPIALAYKAAGFKFSRDFKSNQLIMSDDPWWASDYNEGWLSIKLEIVIRSCFDAASIMAIRYSYSRAIAASLYKLRRLVKTLEDESKFLDSKKTLDEYYGRSRKRRQDNSYNKTKRFRSKKTRSVYK